MHPHSHLITDRVADAMMLNLDVCCGTLADTDWLDSRAPATFVLDSGRR
jgi:hypothetical protein